MASNDDDDDLVGLFQLASLTTAGRPVLLPGEVERHLLPAVDLEPEPSSSIPTFPPYKSGLLILTTHRLLWIPSSVSAVAVPLSAVTHIFSHKKSIKSMFHSPRLRFQARGVVVTAVARGGAADVEAFLVKFWECWRARVWEEEKAADPGGEGLYGGDGTVRMVGVAGILRKEQEIWETTDKTLQEAFQDLNALMSKAKEMMMLAEKMRQKLLPGSSSQGNAGNDEGMGSKEEMQDWLLSVDIISPVTRESAGALYHQQLSRQNATGESWRNDESHRCLLSLQSCSGNRPVMLRKFDSGVMVIQNKSHSDEEIFARIKSLATKSDLGQ